MRRSAHSIAGALVVGLWTLTLGCGSDVGLDDGIDDDFCHGIADGTACDDGNVCTSGDRCGGGVCLGKAVDDGLTCDDGSACSVDDACVAGACAGAAVDCSDLDGGCTAGVCAEDTGECVATAINAGGACDDGDLCTVDDVCDDAGACAGEDKTCTTSSPCLTSACQPEDGLCSAPAAVPDGGACDDDDLCTTGDTCQGGACAGAAVDCSDLNATCVRGTCDPTDGTCAAVEQDDGTVCDDGNPCTDGETCVEASCGGGVQIPNDSLCDDEIPCTEDDACQAGVCIGQAKDCGLAAPDACVNGVCNEGTGDCELEPVVSPDCFCFDQADGTPCDDSQLCTATDACLNGACVGQAIDCSANDDTCNTSHCNPATGQCAPKPRSNGTPCDDGVRCTMNDGCNLGMCTGTRMDCSGLDTACAFGVCRESDGSCVVETAADGFPCDDGDICSGGDECQGGVCDGAFDLCAACSGGADGGGCGDGDLCTATTTCIFTVDTLVCIGEPKNCAQLNSPCTVGDCDSATGDCVPRPVPDGVPCDDGDPCTSGDLCVAGACQAGPMDCTMLDDPCHIGLCDGLTGQCRSEVLADGTECDDGNPCTLSGTCGDGLCVAPAKDCGDAEAECILGMCDPATGDCGVPAPNGSQCEDMNVCTVNDACTDGVCGGFDTCFCNDKPDDTPCDDNQRCTSDDRCESGSCLGQPIDCSGESFPCNDGACDPATGQCITIAAQTGDPCSDGDACTLNDTCVAGVCQAEDVDCSGLDGQCGVGVCDAGACVLDPVATGTPCNDGEPCTGADACDGGLCSGSIQLCTCGPDEIGQGCDDSDPCTEDDTCTEQGGLRLCLGAPKDCSDVDDQCVRGVCNTTSGVCDPIARPPGLPCDDGEPCTEFDACAAGACVGADIDLCGATVLFCEPPAPNDAVSDATMVPLGVARETVLAWIAPVAETDWFAVDLLEGHLLSVEARPHCGGAIDTQFAVYAPDGVTELASDDDGGVDSYSRLDEVEIPADGTYYVGVTAYEASGVGTYLLDFFAEFPPPCVSNDDCDCAELACVTDPGSALLGQCVSAAPVELEPNDQPQTATPTAVDAAAMGRFTLEDDDWYVVALDSAIPVTIATSGFCGEPADPEVWIYDELGLNVLAYDADSGGEGHARIARYRAPATGNYRVRVADEASLEGGYVLSIADARCRLNADCECADQQCAGSPASPGECVPALSTPETGPTAPPSPLILGERMHAAINAPFDTDSFVISLAAGKYDFETVSYCGTDTDVDLAIFNPAGVQIAEDADSGEGFFAKVSGLTLPTAGSYRVRVKAYGPGVGPYVLTVRATPTP